MKHDTVNSELRLGRWGFSSSSMLLLFGGGAVKDEGEITEVLTSVANVQLVKDEIAPVSNLWWVVEKKSN